MRTVMVAGSGIGSGSGLTAGPGRRRGSCSVAGRRAPGSVVLHGVVKVAGGAELTGRAAHPAGCRAGRWSRVVVIVAVIAPTHGGVSLGLAMMLLLQLWLLQLLLLRQRSSSNASGGKFSFSALG